MESADIARELHIYIRTIMGMVLGLGLTRLLGGLARFVQTSGERRIYLIHILWVAYLFLAMVTFWWWEVELVRVEHWTFLNYLFVIAYTSSFFFLAALLFPDTPIAGKGYTGYLLARRHWFFGFLAVNLAADFVDTAMKGPAYIEALGPLYIGRNLLMIALCIVATRTGSTRYHAAFAFTALILEIVWTIFEYQTPFTR